MYQIILIWTSISARVAVVLTVVLVVIGIVGGYVANEIHQAELKDMLQYLEQVS